MGNALQALGRYEEALVCYDRALAIEKDYVEALNNRGNALQALNRHEEALASYARAIALKPNDAEAHWNEGLTRLALGDYRRGWEKYEWRWYNRKLDSPRPHGDTPAWDGTQGVTGKTVLLYPEQGFGDAIQFVRYAPLVRARGARVLVACHRKLAELFRSVDGIDEVLEPERPLPSFDYHAALMSLPLAFRTTLESIPCAIPYVSAKAEQVAAFEARFKSERRALKVGLVWSGNPQFTGARAKACPIEVLEPLVNVQDCAFYALQTGEAAADIERMTVRGPQMTELSLGLDSFSDTAAAVSALDLVIAVDTAVAHLAGALGKPAWILLQYAADWRWLRSREDSPWYPSIRLFRQPEPGHWESVVGRMTGELVTFLNRLRTGG
jgi:hypothetical protein